MTCIIYTRFSPRKNAEESMSCETQEAQCREHAEAQGWPVAAVYADPDRSGKDPARPGLRDAIAALGRGDVLLVYNRDRIARDVLIAELTRRQVKAAGATIAAVSGDVQGDGPTEVFVRQIMDAVAELERKRVSAKTKDAMLLHQKNGRRMGRYAPYGWKLDPKRPGQLLIDEDEREATDRIRGLAREGHTAYAITKAMNEDHPELARAGKWNVRTVKKIMGRG